MCFSSFLSSFIQPVFKFLPVLKYFCYNYLRITLGIRKAQDVNFLRITVLEQALRDQHLIKINTNQLTMPAGLQLS